MPEPEKRETGNAAVYPLADGEFIPLGGTDTFTPKAEGRAKRFYGRMRWLCAAAAVGGHFALLMAWPRAAEHWPWTLGAWPALFLAWGAVENAGMRRFRTRRRLWKQPFPEEGAAFLERRVDFYRSLDGEGRARFIQGVKVFLHEVPAHGAPEEEPDIRWLVAASFMTVFWGLEEIDWTATGLREILFVPDIIPDGAREDDGIVTEYEEAGFLGGEGVFNGVVTLALPELREDIDHPAPGVNVVVHEFAHLYEDGGHSAPIDPQRWRSRAEEEWRRVRGGDGLLEDYALADEHELFALATEWFFTSPRSLQRAHPGLHRLLADAYRFDAARSWPEDSEDVDYAPAPRRGRRRNRRRTKRRRRRSG